VAPALREEEEEEEEEERSNRVPRKGMPVMNGVPTPGLETKT
jgi:hypothetical protein